MFNNDWLWFHLGRESKRKGTKADIVFVLIIILILFLIFINVV